jgi:hypothetical protein
MYISAGIAQSEQRLATGWSSSPGRVKNVLDDGAYPTPYPMGTGGAFPGIKVAGE